MIIQRYISREVALTFGGVSLLLVLMYMSGTFVRLLAGALEGDFPADMLFSLFALKAGGNLVLILPLALMLAVLLAMGRLYQDSEMAAMQACGIGPKRLLVSVGGISLLIAALVAGLILIVTPWTEEQAIALLDEAKGRSNFDLIARGRFNDFGEGAPTLYVEEKRGDGLGVSGVFAHLSQEGTVLLFTAERATRHRNGGGEEYLLLHDGYRYEGVAGGSDYTILKFEEYGLRIPKKAIEVSERPLRATPTLRLWQSRLGGDHAELHWRIALPISTLLLALLAVLLSKSAPRKGRFGKLFLGLLIYLVYSNMLTVGRSYLKTGELPTAVGLWWVHALMVVLIITLYYRQQQMPLARRRLVVTR